MPIDQVGVKRTNYVVAHQRPGRGTLRWEVGRLLKRGGTDRSFGEGMTKLEAKRRAADVNEILSTFVEQRNLADAYDDLTQWLTKWSELASSGRSREIEELKKIRQQVLEHLRKVSHL